MSETGVAGRPVQRLCAEGGFVDRPHGLASLAVTLMTAPVTGTTLSRAVADGRDLRAVLTARSLHLAVSGPPEHAWPVGGLADNPVGEPVLKAVRALHLKQARAELADPVERALHSVETAVWGVSRWSRYWGHGGPGRPEQAWTGEAVVRVLAQWRPTAPTPRLGAGHHAVPATGPGVWRGGADEETTAAPADPPPADGRAEIAVAVPLTGDHPGLSAVTASVLLGAPHSGRLYVSLRERYGVAYGIAVVPLVRGAQAALLAVVSTTTSRAAECAKRLADEMRAFLSAPPDPAAVAGAQIAAARLRTVAAARLASALPLTAVQRCLLEAGSTSGGPARDPVEEPQARVPDGARPRWAVHGPGADVWGPRVREAW
ncbi:insulinase family protein [Streptomyces olindensis]|uniref:insulinase family protein n=1 Tax=Streptomyces olindensis TaxID=358823 RepID=UPI0033E3C24F